MEVIAVVLMLALAAVPIISIAALVVATGCKRQVNLQRLELNDLRRRLTATEQTAAAPQADQRPIPQAETPAMSFKTSTPAARIAVPETIDPPQPQTTQPVAPPTPPAVTEPMPFAYATRSKSMSPPTTGATDGPPSPSLPSRFSGLEQALGLRWTVWVGGMILFVGAGLFVKYAFEQSWLGPTARVVLGLLTGLGVVVGGERFVRKDMRALGQGLVGVGLAILYTALYGAYGFYSIMPQSVTFALMIFVTTGGMALAIRHHALPISFLAALGGFLTPLMLSTGTDERDTLFAYLLLLDLGVLGVAIFKKWRALDVLAFVGTSVLFAGWYVQYGHDYEAVLGTVLWLSTFYLVFLLIPFVYHLRTATCITGERFFLAVSNAVGMFGWTTVLLWPHHQHTLGLMTLGMGLTYLALGLLTRQRIPKDRNATLAFAGLFLAFIIIAVPIHLDLHAVTIAWAVKAPLLLYLAYRYRYLPVRLGSLIPLILSVVRLFFFPGPWHHESFVLCFNTAFGTGMVVLLAGFCYSLIHYAHRSTRLPLDGWMGSLVGLAAGMLTLTLCHGELWQWLTFRGHEDVRLWSTALIWVLGAGGFAMAAQTFRSALLFLTGLIPLGVAVLLTGGAYPMDPVSPRLFLNGHCLAGLSVTAMLWAFSWGCQAWTSVELKQRKRMSDWLLGLSMVAGALALSAETWLWLDARGQQALGRGLLTVFASGVAWACYETGARRASHDLRRVTVVGIVLAILLGIWGYAFRVEAGSLILLNLRFIGALLPGMLALWYAYALQRQPAWMDPREKPLMPSLYGGLTVFLFVLLSLETYYHVADWIADSERSRWLAQMALSLVWGSYATALLVLGFRIPQAKLRLAGLAVFGVTAVKLVLVDMAQVQEIFRIVSFVGLGVLMIGASYLYHRAAKKLEA